MHQFVEDSFGFGGVPVRPKSCLDSTKGSTKGSVRGQGLGFDIGWRVGYSLNLFVLRSLVKVIKVPYWAECLGLRKEVWERGHPEKPKDQVTQ